MYDLSHPVRHGQPTYPGDPTPVMGHHISYDQSRTLIAEGREFAVDTICLVGGSSTYMDAPRHMNRTGGDVASLPLERLVDLPLVVVAAPPRRREYLSSDFDGLSLRGKAVLLASGWDKHWGTTQYPTGSPYLSPSAAHLLVDVGVALVGIDAILIDDPDDPSPRPEREAHISLLAAGTPIIENMRGLTTLPPKDLLLTVVPPAISGVGSFPVRAFAR